MAQSYSMMVADEIAKSSWAAESKEEAVFRLQCEIATRNAGTDDTLKMDIQRGDIVIVTPAADGTIYPWLCGSYICTAVVNDQGQPLDIAATSGDPAGANTTNMVVAGVPAYKFEKLAYEAGRIVSVNGCVAANNNGELTLPLSKVLTELPADEQTALSNAIYKISAQGGLVPDESKKRFAFDRKRIRPQTGTRRRRRQTDGRHHCALRQGRPNLRRTDCRPPEKISPHLPGIKRPPYIRS